MNYLFTHIRIVAAFAIREVATRYGRSPGGYIWAFLEPIAAIALMSSMMGAFGRAPAVGESFILFYATGFLAFSFYRGMESYLTAAIKSNKNLMMYPVVAPIDPIMGRFILQAITSVLVAAVILGVVVITLRFPIHIHWPPILHAIGLAWTMAFGVAMLNTVLFNRFPLYEKAYTISARPLFLVSGIFYVPTHLPHPLSDLVLTNPITHIVLLFRTGFYRAGTQGMSWEFLAPVSFGAFAVGMVTFRLWPVARTRD